MKRSTHGPTGAPVDRRRKSLRCSRYSSAELRAARVVDTRRSLIGEQALQGVERRMKRRSRRAIDPFAVPATVGHLMVEEPLDDAGDVGAEPHPVRDGPRVDAAVDLAAPVRQVVVLPAGILGEQLRRAAQRRRRRFPTPARSSASMSSPSTAEHPRPLRDRRSRSRQGRTRRPPIDRRDPAMPEGVRRSLRSRSVPALLPTPRAVRRRCRAPPASAAPDQSRAARRRRSYRSLP